jgi:hypothetical protein
VSAPGEREFLESFFLWIYTPRAHNDGTVAAIVEDVLAFPHKQSTADLLRFLDGSPRPFPEPSSRARTVSPTSRSRRCPTSGTATSTPSGEKSRRRRDRGADHAAPAAWSAELGPKPG